MRPNVRVLTEAMPGYFAEKKAQQAALERIRIRKSEEEKDLDMLASLLILACLIAVVVVLAFAAGRP